MDALSVSPVGPATLSALRALPPVQAQTPPTQAGIPSGPAALSAQNLVQTLFQRSLQTASLFPVTEPAAGSAALVQGATASLLSALTPAQTPASLTPAPDATALNPPLQASDSTSSAPSPTAPAPNVQDLPATQDAFETSLSPDFAMQTALRFGAGVVAQAAVAVPATDLGTGLVRDAATVLRLENLQPRAGGPGPEAFAQPGTPTQRILRTYEAGSATQGASAVDLLA